MWYWEVLVFIFICIAFNYAIAIFNIRIAGDSTPGNKMDSSNLATVFAPNILHCIKPGAAGKEIRYCK